MTGFKLAGGADCDVLVGLVDLAPMPDTDDLRDPGLHPGFQLYFANTLIPYLACAPYRLNALLSVYTLTTHGMMPQARALTRFSRTLLLDSGCISLLLACLAGKATGADVRDWLTHTDTLVDVAWECHAHGAPPGILASMDLPAYGDMLAAADLTVAQGEALTLENAALMRTQELPPGWRPMYTTQGLTLAEQERCLDGYARLGIVDDIHAGRAWLAVGGMAFEPDESRVWRIHRRLREHLGPTAHIHALGVSRHSTLVPMIRAGWVNSADSSSANQEVRYNRGPYRVAGPRPSMLVYAMHAAAALLAEAALAVALTRATGPDPLIQEQLL